ncbi:hypothetical protein FB384_002833 [Prauserella sediminis]|uniref:Uncharacterized protein n=1 Tax=Prauserella sediminis TaxID=577680 RepID=A0A839XPU7_9PSEU|nr:hypothetical protein [Prauserella sediminis]
MSRHDIGGRELLERRENALDDAAGNRAHSR